MISANKKYFLKNETFVVRAISDEYSGYGDIVFDAIVLRGPFAHNTKTTFNAYNHPAGEWIECKSDDIWLELEKQLNA